MKRREMKLLLEERFERIALLETRIDTMDQLVEGYRAREQAILDTLQSAKERTAKMLVEAGAEAEQTRAKAKAESEELVRLVKEEAERTLRTARAEAQQELASAKSEAERTRASAKADADALLTDASAVSGTLRADAEKRTTELVAIAKADSDRMLRDVEIIKREYEEMVESFNAMLAQNATELEVTAARFAEFVKDRKIDPPEIRMDGDAFYKSVGVLNDAALPDASENPAMLMQNIYRIQNRPLPEDFLEDRAAGRDEGEEKIAHTPEPEREVQTTQQSEQTTAWQVPKFPMEDGSGADERAAAVEPFSEAAWADGAQESTREPQAEFTKAFENAYPDSDFVIHGDGCQLTLENATEAFDAAFAAPSFAAGAATVAIPASAVAGVASHAETEQMFDEIFSEQLESGGKLAQDGAKPEPYSEAAWSTGAFMSDHEPQAEGALFSGEVEHEAAPAAGESVPVVSAENVIDDYFANFNAFGSTATTTPEPAAKPEPYSEAAWATGAFMSDHEPQAEGALFSGEVEREVPPSVGESVPAADAENVIDDYFANLSAFGSTTATTTPEPAAKPEPYSEAAWATGAFMSDHEPQAEGALFSGEVEREVAPDAGESVPVVGAENVIDDYFANLSTFGSTATITPEPATKPEPYSEAAWATGAFLSDHEPQAEGALFSSEVEPVTEPAGQPASNYDTTAARTFDSYFPSFETSATPEPEPAAKPEPYSETAWATGSFTSDHEPQAEGALFSGETEPVTEPAGQPASNYDTTAASTFDSFFPSFEASATPEPEPAAKPEPYSETAWATGSFTSDHEPQAEGNLYAEAEEEEPAPAPRKYNEYGQVREWEPEPEPDMDDIPTVSRYMGKSEPDGEISLDDLLDEIIKAGE